MMAFTGMFFKGKATIAGLLWLKLITDHFNIADKVILFP